MIKKDLNNTFVEAHKGAEKIFTSLQKPHSIDEVNPLRVINNGSIQTTEQLIFQPCWLINHSDISIAMRYRGFIQRIATAYVAIPRGSNHLSTESLWLGQTKLIYKTLIKFLIFGA